MHNNSMKMTILIVDDDPDARTVLRRFVEDLGHEAREARDGRDGLDAALRVRPDAIISDGLMPRMDGFQLLRAVRKDETLKSVPFILYTSIYTEDHERSLALSLGADELIVKPTTPAIVWEKILSAIKAREEGKAPQAGATHQEKDEEFLRDYNRIMASKLEAKVREMALIIAELNRTKTVLQESKERYRLLFDNNPHPMWVYDIETLAFLAINNAAIAKYGYSREEFLGMTIKDIRRPEDVRKLLSRVSTAAEGFDNAGIWKHRKKDGTIIDVEITSHTFEFSGRLAKLILASDVTERVRMEKAIRHASDEWRSTFDAMNDAIALMDSDGRILRCNKAMADLVGKDFQEITGRQCWDIIHHASGPIEQCPVEIVKKTLKRETLVVPMGRKWFEITADPILDAAGALIGVVHIMTDITERKQLEDELKAAVVRAGDEKARSESIIAAIGDGITIQDRDFKILYQNQTAKDMIGDHVGARCYMAYEKRDRPCEGCGVALAFEDGRTHVVERSAPTDKGLIYVEITASPLRDSTGNIIAGIEVVHDITERKRRDEALRASEEKHRLLFQESPVGIFHYNASLIITDSNDRFVEILKSKRERLLGLDMHTLRDQRVLPSLEAILKGKEGRYEGEYKATTGLAEIFVSMRTAPLFGPDGAVKGGIGIVEDITERKQAEVLLQEQRAFTENLMQNSTVAIFVLDAQHKVLIWNKACEELTGIAAVEMVGTVNQWKPFYSKERPVLADAILDNDEKKLSELYPEYSNSVLMPEGLHVERWIRNLNGKDKYVVFDAAPIRNSAGNIIAAIESLQDFTLRKRMEDEIEQAKVEWEETFNTITDMVTVHDKDYNIIRANKAAEQILGLPFLEAGRIKCFKYYHGTACPPEGCPSCQSLTTGKPTVSEIFEPHLNKYIEIQAIPRFDRSNQINGLIHIVRDISERKRAEGELIDRAHQAALGAEIGDVLTRGDDLSIILQRCAEAMVKHLDAAFARIWTLNKREQTLELQSSAGIYTHINGAHGRVPMGKFKIGLIAEERKPHLTNQVISDPRVADQEWAKKEGMVAFAGYPLIVQDRLVGVMAMFSRNRLTEGTMSSLASVADIIALGIERKRTESALERYSKELTALNAASNTLMLTTKLKDIYQEICNIIFSVFDLKMVWLGIIEENNYDVMPVAFAGHEDGYLSTIKVTWDDSAFGRGPTGTAIKTKTMISTTIDDLLYAPWKAEAQKRGYLTSLSVPIMYAGNRCIGALNFYSGAADYFTPDRLRLCQIFANQAAIAIENTRLVIGLEYKVQERTKALEDTNIELSTLNKEVELRREEAESASRSKTDFLANMSHELRTPLNAIMGFSDIMVMGLAGPVSDKQKEFLTDISASGNHLLTLINDILDLSKIEAGKVELEPSTFLLRELIESSLVMFKEKALKHNIRVETNIDETLTDITADQRKLKQILVNLLANAFKFTPDGGSVSVRARLTRDEGRGTRDEKEKASVVQASEASGRLSSVEISIADTGIGISPEHQKKLFQPFQQIETSLTRKYAGTGLGLSLCRRFVELHGGRIWIDSEEGKGSVFTFIIPMRAGQERKP